ncbi:MAG: SPOR domain-containing protein [Gammaproteobacteria bacterium]|nr:SPOR domain-containing protein [Gammaproteobacteria bacterium]MDH3560814.1 SPOR domain-containing protein [Gammaproteobacteria bacterium]
MDQKLKQRLVGAVVLISLAVIFIPIILEGPDDEWSPRTQGMPEPPKIDYRAEIELPLSDSGPSPQQLPAIVEPVAEQADAPESVADQSVPEPPAVVPEPMAPAPAPAAATVVPADAWVIQVGSFSLQPNAGGLRDRLRRAGFPVFLQDKKTASGNTTYRVLVGPLDDRAAAEKLHQRLIREQQLKGLVVQGDG